MGGEIRFGILEQVVASAGILADTKWQVSFLAGYAGTDFIESLYIIKLARDLKI